MVKLKIAKEKMAKLNSGGIAESGNENMAAENVLRSFVIPMPQGFHFLDKENPDKKN